MLLKISFKICGPFKFKELEKECEKLWKFLSHCVIVSTTDFVSPELKNRKTPHSLRLSSSALPPIFALFKHPGYINAPLRDHFRKSSLETRCDLKNLHFGCFCTFFFFPEKSGAFTMRASWNFTTLMPKIFSHF